MSNMTVLHHPAAEDVQQQFTLAPRLSSLKGKTIALIDNHKKNADLYLNEVSHLLKSQYGVAEIVHYRKDSQSMPTPTAIMDDLTRRCDALIHGIAD